MTRDKSALPQGFRTAPPGLLSPAQLLDAARVPIRFADAAKARGEPIMEERFRRRAYELRTKGRRGISG